MAALENSLRSSLSRSAAGEASASAAVNAAGTRAEGSLGQVRFSGPKDEKIFPLSSVPGLRQIQELSKRVLGKRDIGNNANAATGGSQLEAGPDEPAVADRLEARDITGKSEKVVIVGGGIAGLTTAVALQRVGVNVLLLEQSPSLRALGSSITLWSNAWRALDYIGVADILRREHILIKGLQVSDQSGEVVKRFDFSECPGGPHEVRTVYRRRLVEVLAEQLPAGSVQLNARVKKVEKESHEEFTKVYLEDGFVISTKVLLGCDGVNSVVARYVGLSPSKYVGQVGIRGVAHFPEGHDFGHLFFQFSGHGRRAGCLPFTDKEVYWFIVFNHKTREHGKADPARIKEEALEIADEWPHTMKDLVNRSPLGSLSRSPLADRWTFPWTGHPKIVKDGVTILGDAFHPTTPNLGQGGCMAIEDGVTVARALAGVFSGKQGQKADAQSIQKALEQYSEERQTRTNSITRQSFMIGALFLNETAPVAFVRDKFLVPKMLSPNTYLDHTLFDVGQLPVPTEVPAESLSSR